MSIANSSIEHNPDLRGAERPTMTSVGGFGPWSPGLNDPVERGKQFRSLAALSAAFLGANHEIVSTLRHAENDDAAAARALELLDRTPSLTRRRLLSVFSRVTWGWR